MGQSLYSNSTKPKKFRMEDGKRQIDLLRVLLKSKKKSNIIYTGSFALYHIKNNTNIPNSIQLKISDIDIDAIKALDKIGVRGEIAISKKNKVAVVEKLEHYFGELLIDFKKHYNNIKDYGIEIKERNIKTREGNYGTLGITVVVHITNTEGITKSVKIDTNIESKMFETEFHDFYLENEYFRAQTYSYDKIIADKMLAIHRHLQIYSKQLENTFDILNILEKLAKDFYDLNYVSQKDHSNAFVEYYIKIMKRNFGDIEGGINEFILTQLQEINSKILLNRGSVNISDISKLKELIDLALRK